MAQAYPTRSLRELARVLFSRAAGIIVILVVVIAGVVAATHLSRWKYRSRWRLMARPMAVSAAGEDWATLKDRLSLFVGTQCQLIQDDYVIASALMRMDKQKRDGAVGPDGQKWYAEATVAKYAAAHVGEIADCHDRISVQTPGGPDVTSSQTFTITVDWPEQRELASRLGQKDSRAFAAGRAHDFTTYLVSAYRAYRAEIETKAARQRSEHRVATATRLAEDNRDEARQELIDYIVKELAIDPVLAESMLTRADDIGSQSLSTRYQVDTTAIRANIKALDTMAGGIAAEFAKGPDAKLVIPEELLKANPSLGKKLEAIALGRLKLNSLTPQYTEDYEHIKHTRAELDANTADVKQEVLVMIQQKRATEQARLMEYEDAVAKEKQDVADLAAKIPQLRQLKADFDSAQEICSDAKAESIKAQRAEALAAAPVEVDVVGSASRPDPSRPHRPIFWLNVLVGVVAGLILSLIYAFAADHYDHSLKGMGDVERYVGIDVLASIPKFRRRMIRAQ